MPDEEDGPQQRPLRMDIIMPPTFPEEAFQAYGIAGSEFFAPADSEETLFDPYEKRRHFSYSWQAVRYRYRLSAECRDQFVALLGSIGGRWTASWSDEELTYQLERSIYTFFMAALSVFDTFYFSLYYLGQAKNPTIFPLVAEPQAITRSKTAKAFDQAFGSAAPITKILVALQKKPAFCAIHAFRNILAHRLSGRRSLKSWSTVQPDGTRQAGHEETWRIPGSPERLTFDEELLQRHFDAMTALLTEMVAQAREFAEENKPRR